MSALAHLLKRASDWHEGRSAMRMLTASLVSYLFSTAIDIPAPYTAVITTLIVARPHSEGVLRASLERVLATMVGAAIACGVSFGRLAHTPEPLLLAIALIPITLVVAHNSAYRSAMIAAIIVLSAPAVQGSPFYVAGIRMLGVAIGAVIGTLISLTVVPSSREVLVARAAANLLDMFVPLLRDSMSNEKKNSARYRLEFRIRQSLREFALLIKDRPDGPPTKSPAAAVVQSVLHVHADIVFLARELRAHTPPESAMPLIADSLSTFQTTMTSVTGQIRAGAARQTAGFAPTKGRPATTPPGSGGAPRPTAATPGAALGLYELHRAVAHAAGALREQAPHGEGVRLMLSRLLEDLGAAIHSLRRIGALEAP
jgi:uncharacterized membrane protein YccC